MGFFKKKGPLAEARHGWVSGRVQSVAFRFYTRQEATQLQLGGWVQNLSDGRVEFHVQGEPAALQEFLAWVHVGPPLAKVADVQLESVPLQECEGFEVR